MAEIIKDFSRMKVADYLHTCLYDKVLLRFYHGLGDAVMFQPVLKALRDKFPTIEIDQELRYGQENLWESRTERDKNYDAIFIIGFPCSEWRHPEYTKGEWCCIQELGIEPVRTPYKMEKRFKSPLVGMHFFSTCCPSLNCPEKTAKEIRDKIIASGLIPIDTDLKHQCHNPKNVRYSWNSIAIDSTKASLSNLAGLLQRCCGFVGVPSGNWVLATSLLPPERILFLESSFPASSSVRQPVLSMKCGKYDNTIVDKWIENIKNEEY